MDKRINKEINELIDHQPNLEKEFREELKENLNELISDLITYYSKPFQSINLEEYKEENFDSLEDLLLKRLKDNIKYIKTVNPHDTKSKGYYKASSKEIAFNLSLIDKQINPKSFPEEKLNTIIKKAREKVIKHEFEHGLQAQFKNGKKYASGFGYSEKGKNVNLLEIFNESESIEMANCPFQDILSFDDQNYIPIYNL